MKNRLVFFIVIIGLMSAIEAKEQTSLESDGLVGNVKTFIERSYYVKEEYGEWTTGDKSSTYLYAYDKAGNRINYSSFDDEDMATITFLYTYNSKGNPFETNYYSKGVLQTKYLYSYDANDKVTSKATYGGDGLLKSILFFSYDTNGSLLKEEGTYYNNGSISIRTLHTYGEKGLIEKRLQYSGSGSFILEAQYRYDDKGNLTEEVDYNNEGLLESNLINIYDSNDNMTGKVNFKGGVLRSLFTYRYNEKNKLAEIIEYRANGMQRDRTIYQYDEMGNYKGVATYDVEIDKVSIIDFIHLYDENGNWTKKIESRVMIEDEGNSLKPEKITFRDITYF